MTMLESQPVEYYWERCAAESPFLLGYATARLETPSPRLEHCVLSAESELARTTEGLCSRRKKRTVSSAPTFHAAQTLAVGQVLRRSTDLPKGQCSARGHDERMSCSVHHWGHWHTTHPALRRQGRRQHGPRDLTLSTASARTQGLLSSGVHTGDLRSATEETSR